MIFFRPGKVTYDKPTKEIPCRGIVGEHTRTIYITIYLSTHCLDMINPSQCKEQTTHKIKMNSGTQHLTLKVKSHLQNQQKWRNTTSSTEHYGDVIMGATASQITSLTIVYSTVYSDADQRKHQSSASLTFVRGIHQGPVNSPHKWPVTRKMFPFDDVIMRIENKPKKVTFSIHTKVRDMISRHYYCILHSLIVA